MLAQKLIETPSNSPLRFIRHQCFQFLFKMFAFLPGTPSLHLSIVAVTVKLRLIYLRLRVHEMLHLWLIILLLVLSASSSISLKFKLVYAPLLYPFKIYSSSFIFRPLVLNKYLNYLYRALYNGIVFGNSFLRFSRSCSLLSSIRSHVQFIKSLRYRPCSLFHS